MPTKSQKIQGSTIHCCHIHHSRLSEWKQGNSLFNLLFSFCLQVNWYSNPSWIFSTVLHLFQGQSSSKTEPLSFSLLFLRRYSTYRALNIIIGFNFFFWLSSNRNYFILYQRRFNLPNEISQQCKRNILEEKWAHKSHLPF